ncbi:MAG: DNA-binding response regulator, partial [Verrucomicrobia bacterium]
SGGNYVTASLARKLARHLQGRTERVLHENLSDREYEVLLLIARGKRVKEIAAELNLSVKTISTHRDHILRKLKFFTTAELIRYALQNRLVD